MVSKLTPRGRRLLARRPDRRAGQRPELHLRAVRVRRDVICVPKESCFPQQNMVFDLTEPYTISYCTSTGTNTVL